MGKKWHNQSVYKLNEALSEAGRISEAFRITARAMNAQIALKETEAKAELYRVLMIAQPHLTLTPDAVVFGGWECEDSPTKRCIYNSHRDPLLDRCIFCNEPSERD